MLSDFQGAYPFQFLGRFKAFGQELLRYAFVSTQTNKKYIVEFELFPNDLYGMKFYLDDFKKSKNRYKMLTATMVSDEKFVHVVLDEQSAYLLINKRVNDVQQYILDVQTYMIDNYSDFDS